MLFEIKQGDARTFDPIQADLIVTDPPYKLTSGGGNLAPGTKRMSGKFNTDNYSNDGNIVQCDITWPEIFKVIDDNLADNGEAFVMCNDKNMREALVAAHNVGLKLHNILVWDKVNATPNRWFMKNCEYTLYLWKGEAKYINDCGLKQLITCPIIADTEHPTEKPVDLMRYYIAACKDLDTPAQTIVLDPFMGTGATGVAAIREGCAFYGYELEEDYVETAAIRMVNANNQGELF